MKEKTTLELAHRMNQIAKEMNDLEVEYNMIIHELWERIPKLEKDVNIQPIKTKRR